MLTTKRFNELMNQSKTLTPEEETSVFEYYNAHKTQDVRNQIALKNKGLIWSVVNVYSHLGIDREDLFQEGFFGIVTAIDKFDYLAGYKFSTYAMHWIRNTVSRYILNFGHTIRLPVHISEKCMRIQALQKEYEQKYGVMPTNEYLASKLDMDVKSVQKIMLAVRENDILSLNRTIGTETDEGTEMITCIPSSKMDIADEAVINVSVAGLDSILDRVLTEKEKTVISYRYGLITGDTMTLEEVGKLFGLTRERIRQIEVKALRKLASCRDREALHSMMECLSA